MSIAIYLKTLTGQTKLLDIEPSDEVSRIKEEVSDLEGIPVSQQRLTFAGRMMEDECTLEDYRIYDEATIHLVLLRGEINNIFLKTPAGEVVALELSLLQTISEVKLKILDKIGISTAQQILMFAGKRLENRYTLAYYNIQRESTLRLEQRNFNIYVKTLSGNTISIYIINSDTVEDLKLIIYEIEGIPPCDQRLMYGDVHLQDEREVSDYNIQPQSTLLLFLRLRAGDC